MNENVSLRRIAGIHVGFNWRLVVVATLIAWSLATSLLPSAAPGQRSGVYWPACVISVFVFLSSFDSVVAGLQARTQRGEVTDEGDCGDGSGCGNGRDEVSGAARATGGVARQPLGRELRRCGCSGSCVGIHRE